MLALPAPGREGGGVRILSIHKSKGLEFPFVFLCDTARLFNKSDARESVLVHPVLGLGPKCTDLEHGVEYPTIARQAIAAQLPALEAAANAELRRQGSGDTACVSFRRELFPTRDYDTFSLPSGVYQSLRVTIGEGAGHNWWCVIFPSLCVPATTDGFADAAAAGGFSDAEIGLMTRANGAYTVKFRSLELLQALKKYLFGE